MIPPCLTPPATSEVGEGASKDNKLGFLHNCWGFLLNRGTSKANKFGSEVNVFSKKRNKFGKKVGAKTF